MYILLVKMCVQIIISIFNYFLKLFLAQIPLNPKNI